MEEHWEKINGYVNDHKIYSEKIKFKELWQVFRRNEEMGWREKWGRDMIGSGYAEWLGKDWGWESV